MEVKFRRRIMSTLDPNNDHPYMSGAFTPNFLEVDVPELQVIQGAVPRDLDGVYIRNTEQPTHQPIGNYHPFDGDAMLHQVEFTAGGPVSYRCRFVETAGFREEQQAGAPQQEHPGAG